MSARPPHPTPAAPRPRATTVTTTLLTALVVLGAATATPWRLGLPDTTPPAPEAPPAPTPAPTPTGLADAEPADTTVLTVVVIVLAALGAALLLVLLTLLARRVLAALPGPDTDEPAEPDDPGTGATTAGPTTLPPAELADAVHLALARVDAATTPHDAVVAAWVALEDAAATHGTVRDPAETPTEFTTRLLHHAAAPRTHVTTLRTLYAEARFTARPVTTRHVDRARHALRHIARALDTPDDAPPPTTTGSTP